MKRIRRDGPVILFYSILALVLTYPLVLNLTTHVPGDGRDDPPLVWNLWWVKFALLTLHQNPLQTDYLFAPIGVNLAFYTPTLLNGLLSIPLQWAFGLIAASNLILLSSFVLSAYGAYLLVDYTLSPGTPGERAGGRGFPAFVAGLVYAFAPAKLIYAALGQFNIASSQWLPFYVLFLLRATGRDPLSQQESAGDSPLRPGERSGLALSAGEGVRWRDALLAGLCFVLAGYAEFTFASFAGLFTLVYLVYLWAREGRRFWTPGRLGRLLLIGIVVLAGLSPVFLTMFAEMQVEGDYTLGQGWGFADIFSADLLGFLMPSHLHPLFGDLARQLTTHFSYTNFVSLGWVVILLGLVGAGLAWRRGDRLWVYTTLTFLILSLGPVLRINGRWLFDLDGLPVRVPLPFIILHYLPILKANRYPSRLVILVLLGLAVLVGFALARLGQWLVTRRGEKSRAPALLAGILALLILGEYLAVPLPLSDMRVPAVYQTVAAPAGDRGVLLDLPLTWRNSFAFIPVRLTTQKPPLDRRNQFQQYYQSVHQRPLLAGNTSRNPEFTFSYFLEAPVIRSLIALEENRTLPADVKEADRALAPLVLGFFGVQDLLIHPPYVDTKLEEYVREVLPVTFVGESEGIRHYRVTMTGVWPESVGLGDDLGRLLRGPGWGGVEMNADGSRYRYSSRATATLLIPVWDRQAQEVRLWLRPAMAGQTVTLALNGQALRRVTLTGDWQEVAVTLPAGLTPGIQKLTLTVDHTTALPAGPFAIGQTRRSSPVPIVVESAGLEAGDFAHIWVNGRDVSLNRRGFNLAVIDPASGAVLQTAWFDTFAAEENSQKLAALLDRVPAGQIVALAVRDEGSLKLEDEAIRALRTIGVATDLRGQFRSGLAVIGVRGAAPGTALEAAGRAGPLLVAAGPAVQGDQLGIALRQVVVR